MFIKEKEYNKPQFELVVINSVDIMVGSDNNVGIDELFGSLRDDNV